MIVLDIETYYAKDYSLSARGKNALTTEEYINDPRFRLHGIGVKKDDSPARWFTRAQFESSLPAFKALFARQLCVGHNMRFDAASLAWRYGVKFGALGDTLSMARPIVGVDAPASLGALAERFGLGQKGRELHDFLDVRDLTPEQSAILGGYCCNDVELTYKLFLELRAGFPEEELQVIDLMLRMFVEPAVELDVERLRRYHLMEVAQKRAFMEKIEHLESVKEMIASEKGKKKKGVAGVLGSGDKFAKVLWELGVAPPQKISPKTGKLTWAFAKNDAEFKALADHPEEMVRMAVEARLGVKSTLGETRSARFIQIAERNNGKLPIPKKYWGAHTGRDCGEERVNLANLPRGGELRAAMVVPKGYVICAADSANIEARVLPWLAGQQDWLDIFHRQDLGIGKDAYSVMATKIYGVEIDRKKNPDQFIEGHVGKCTVLGCGFGLGWPKFQGMIRVGMLGAKGVTFDAAFVKNLGVDLTAFVSDKYNLNRAKDCYFPWDNRSVHVTHCAVAKTIIDQYRGSVPAIVSYWKFLNDEVLPRIAAGARFEFGPGGIFQVEKHAVRTPSGFVLHYPGLHQQEVKDEETGRVKRKEWFYFGRNKKLCKTYGGHLAENFTQHIARLPIMHQLTLIAKRYKIITSTYDEIVCLIPEHEAEEGSAWVVDQMRTRLSWMTGLPINAEGNFGRTYKDCK